MAAPRKYRRISELGRGGMATVYLTALRWPDDSQTLVVVKEMRKDIAEDPEFRRMFVEEARVAAGLNHPNIVQTFEVFEESGVFSIVMEFLDGQSLGKLRTSARREVVLPLQLFVASEALAGLQHVHEAGLVHRDVSPQNIFVTYDGEVKLLDFGIVKVTDSSVHTAVGTLKGKLGYMAPEQVLGRRIDRRTDVFAMGVVLWEALTGVRLWANEPEAAIVGRLASGSIPTVRSIKGDVPEELDAICARAMHADPDGRFPTARAFQEAIDEFLAIVAARPSRRDLAQLMTSLFAEKRQTLHALISGALVTPPSAPTSPPTAVTATLSGPTGARVLADKPGRSLMVPVLVVAGAIAFGVVVGVIARRPSPPRVAEATAQSAQSASAPLVVVTPPSSAASVASSLVSVPTPDISSAPISPPVAPRRDAIPSRRSAATVGTPSAITPSQSRSSSVTSRPRSGDPDLGY